MNTGAKYDVLELGVMKPNKIPVKKLRPGMSGIVSRVLNPSRTRE